MTFIQFVEHRFLGSDPAQGAHKGRPSHAKRTFQLSNLPLINAIPESLTPELGIMSPDNLAEMCSQSMNNCIEGWKVGHERPKPLLPSALHIDKGAFLEEILRPFE